MKSARHLSPALLLTAIVVALSAAVPVHAGITSERKLAAIIDRTPMPHVVADGQQMKAAEQVAAGLKDAQVFWGIGQSMEPLYAPNTAVVVEPIAYDNVKKGMTLVYAKRNGRVVAHSVIDEDRNGYVVQGVNNDEPDTESVNEKNIIGVVTHAFAASDTDFRAEWAKRLAAKGKTTLVASAN